MKFDDASWYLELVKIKTDNPYSIASGHIVAYLQWCLKRSWAGILHLQENSSNNALKQALNGDISFTKFFEEQCDFKFKDEDLNDEGNKFTQ